MEYTSARRYDAFKQLPDHHYFDTSEPCHSCAVISSENARLRGLKLINSFHTWARRQIAFINKIHFCFHMGFAQKHFFIRYNANVAWLKRQGYYFFPNECLFTLEPLEMVSYNIVFQQTKVPIKDKLNMKNYCTTVSSARSLERYITFFKIVNWYLLVLDCMQTYKNKYILSRNGKIYKWQKIVK